MEDFSNKILVITNVKNGVCLNDSFITCANNLASSLGRVVDYFCFNKIPHYQELYDLSDKDVLDRLRDSIGKYDFVLIDYRLDSPTLNVLIGFILSEGLQIGSFFINYPNLQSFVESKVLLRKDFHKEDKGTLIVSPDGSGENNPKSISEALDCLILDNYDKIIFLEGNYDMDALYRVLAYCYDTGVIVVNSNLPEGVYIKVIESKW